MLYIIHSFYKSMYMNHLYLCMCEYSLMISSNIHNKSLLTPSCMTSAAPISACCINCVTQSTLAFSAAQCNGVFPPWQIIEQGIIHLVLHQHMSTANRNSFTLLSFNSCYVCMHGILCSIFVTVVDPSHAFA